MNEIRKALDNDAVKKARNHFWGIVENYTSDADEVERFGRILANAIEKALALLPKDGGEARDTPLDRRDCDNCGHGIGRNCTEPEFVKTGKITCSLNVPRSKWIPIVKEPAPSSETPETTKPCAWVEDSDGTWNGTCGIAWVFSNDDGPNENDMHYCPKCGKPLVEEPYSDADDDEPSSKGADE